ncbi:monocarboxylate transporter 13-like [Acanthaster planci]|uniref:Monocarboxylate transporter 13-like n=1 Tax=Acanthaster planci TaxID=133434 RepID=A0A8B7XTA6_ACAPL|nr:monocarboxylate transporter 13-like [Acanthaster planci]XP_022084089.1 monocarboxylate transporter 13-like [Acanthaster planci]
MAPKDGVWGWFVVVSAFMALYIRMSTTKVFAVLLPSIRDDMQLDTWVVGSLISVMLTLSDFTGLPAAWLCIRSSHRLVVMTGGLMVCVGIISCSLAIGTVHLLLSVIVTGIGMGLVENPPLAMIGSYFQAHYATATSLALSSFPLAVVSSPPMAQLLLDTYGWRGTLLVWGGTTLHIVACGAVLRPVVVSSGEERGCVHIASGDEGHSRDGKAPVSRLRKFIQSNHLGLLKNLSFFTVVSVLCCERLVFSGWVIYLVPHAIQAGLSPYQAVSLPSGTGVANLLGKAVQGVLMDCKLVTSTTLLFATVVTAGLSLMLDPLSDSFAAMFVLGVTYGLAVGTLYPLGMTVLRDLVGDERFMIALGWCAVFLGVFRLPMGFFPGWLYDVSGSYNTSFVVLGAIELLPVPLLTIDLLRRSRWWRCHTNDRRDDYERLNGISNGSLEKSDE